MGRTTTKSNSTYRGYSAKPQSTKSSYVPTRQATSSGGQNSSGDNSWAQRLLEEQKRKQRIADNKVFIAQVKSANSEVKELRGMIAEAEGILANAVTGEQYAKYKQMLASQDAKLQQVGNELNAAGAEAAKNIQKDGEGYIYNNTNTNPAKSYTTNNKGTLSVDTNELRKLQALLEDIEEKSKSVETKVSKIYNTSKEVGVTTGANVSNVKSTTTTAEKLKYEIEQQIKATEKTESENLSIIDKIANWAGNLFKPSNLDSTKTDESAGTTRTRTTTKPTTSTRTTLNNNRTDTSDYWSSIKNKENNVDIFGKDITYNSGYEYSSDVMPYTYLKPSSANSGNPKPLIVWLHGGGKKGVETYSESNYNLTHIISTSELSNFDAYVISPVLTRHDSSNSWWCNEEAAKNVADLIDKFVAENNVDKDNIIIMGGSEGGRGTQYMAATMPEYFSQAVVLSGYSVYGINGSDIEIPVKGYVGGWDDKNSINYMKRLANEIGEENVITVEGATHNKLPKVLYNLDSDGNGKSDFIESLFPNNTVASTTTSKPAIDTTISTRTTISPSAGTGTRTITSSIEQINTQIGEDITNVQPKNNSDIAHRGYTPGGIYDNSAEGFRKAGEKGFWGCEADVRFDADGNLVCSHNTVKNGQDPTSFEEYLDICKEYGMTAIIDLKYEKGVGPADPNLSPEILKTIQEKGMMDSCVLQTNNPTDIPYIRENSEDARIWYLTDVISDDNIKLIEENNVECVNILSSEKNAHRIKKLTENGIDTCVWNVQSETLKESLLNMGAKYVMSDNVLGITPYQEGEEDFNNVKGNFANENGQGLETNVAIEEKPTTSTETTTRTRTITKPNPTINLEPTTPTEPATEPTTEPTISKPTTDTTITKPAATTPTRTRTTTKPTTPTKPTIDEEPTIPTEPTTDEKPTEPIKPTRPSEPSIPSITEPEYTDIPVMQCTPEAVLKAAKNAEITENNSNYICNILHSSGYLTEEEINMYKNWDISEICKLLDERGWDKVINISDLKNGDIIIVNNGEEIRVYAGNNSWYTAGETGIQQGNENWAENTNWFAYRP